MRESSNVPRDTSSRLVSLLLPSYGVWNEHRESIIGWFRVWVFEWDLPLLLSLDSSVVRRIHIQPRHCSLSSLSQADTTRAHAETDVVKVHSAIVEL